MIELKNVSAGYGKRIIISDVNVEFKKGELTSVVGANGCGKSTLLSVCAGLIPVMSGEVLVEGQDISQLKRNSAAKKISYLGQIKSSKSMTVRALVSHGRFPYLGYPRKYTQKDYEKINEAMELAGVSEFSQKLVSELSGGQQQRAHIAMTLAQDTDIILLDEPLTYLDIGYQLEIMELITGLKAMGKTVITVMHDLNQALSCSDRIAVMKEGRVIDLDDPQNIVKNNSLFKALGVNAIYSEDAGQYFFSR